MSRATDDPNDIILRLDRERRRRDMLSALLVGLLVGAMAHQFMTPTVYEGARQNPQTAAEALCSRGYVVTLSGLGNMCNP
jgi:hypothetical protein